jgi:chorismate mutase
MHVVSGCTQPVSPTPPRPIQPPIIKRARPSDYTALIRAGDAAGLMALLTDVPQERRVVERVRVKAATFGQDIELPPDAPAAAPSAAAARLAASAAEAAAAGGGGGGVKFKVSFDALADIYDRIIMPLTKDVQVEYLLRRLDGEDGDGGSSGGSGEGAP